MRKLFNLYAALCVMAVGMLALTLPTQADYDKKSTLANPNTETSQQLNKDNRAAPHNNELTTRQRPTPDLSRTSTVQPTA
jgi:hypothetical protein